MSFFGKTKKVFKKGVFATLIAADKNYHILKRLFIAVVFILLLIPALLYGKNIFFEYLRNTIVVSESEILRRVGDKIDIKNEKPLSVVRVENAELLKTEQDFYKDVEEGDYILVFPDKIIIYDLRGDKIVAEKDTL